MLREELNIHIRIGPCSILRKRKRLMVSGFLLFQILFYSLKYIRACVALLIFNFIVVLLFASLEVGFLVVSVLFMPFALSVRSNFPTIFSLEFSSKPANCHLLSLTREEKSKPKWVNKFMALGFGRLWSVEDFNLIRRVLAFIFGRAEKKHI